MRRLSSYYKLLGYKSKLYTEEESVNGIPEKVLKLEIRWSGFEKE